MKTARALTSLLAAALATAALFHVVLLASDSEAYRQWVYLQIGLLSVCAALLFLSRGTRPGYLAGAFAAAMPAIYVNWKFLNHGSGHAVWLVPAAVAIAVGGLAIHRSRRLETHGSEHQ